MRISLVLLFNVEFRYLPKFLFFIVFHCFSGFSLFPCFSLYFKRFQGFKSLGYSFLLGCLFLGSCYFLWNFLISPLGEYPLLTGGCGYLLLGPGALPEKTLRASTPCPDRLLAPTWGDKEIPQKIAGLEK